MEIKRNFASLLAGHIGRLMLTGLLGAALLFSLTLVTRAELVDGAPDPAFGGGDGVAIIGVGPTYDVAVAGAPGEEGRLFLFGTSDVSGTFNADGAVVLLNPDGGPDPGFDADGRATSDITPFDEIFDGLVDRDGRLVLVGAGASNGGTSALVVRMLGNGSPDPNFFLSGSVSHPW